MDKPASLRRVDLRKDVVEAINASRLPPYVVESILDDVIAEVRRNTEMQYQADLAEWNKQTIAHDE